MDDKQKTKGCAFSCWNKWLRLAATFHHGLERFFYRYGYFIAGYPLIIMLLCVIFTGAVGWGFIWLKIESRSEKLYVPQNSRAERDLEYADKYFTVQNRIARIVITSKERKNMLTKEAFTVGVEVMQGIFTNISIETVCREINATIPPFINAKTAKCMRTDPFELFGYSAQNINNSDIRSKINALYKSTNYTMRNGRSLSTNLIEILGGVSKDNNGDINSAVALRISIPIIFPKTDKEYEKILDWEGKFLKYLTSVKQNLQSKGFDILFFTLKSIDDSVNDSASGDILLITITFTIMCSFTCFALGRYRNRVTGHGLAGMVGILAVAMGVASSFGLLLICGGTFVSLVGILPFLILGVAIDDIFIILDELDRTDFNLPTREIIAKVLGRVGGTVTMTTLTDLVAFAVSTTSAFPAIQYFCAFAAMGITFSYLMIMTFFVAFLVFDIKRIKAGRWDMIPFVRNADFKIDEDTGLIVPPEQQWSVKITETFKLQMLGKDGSDYIQFLDVEQKYFTDVVTVNIVVPGSFRIDTVKGQLEYSKLGDVAIKSSPQFQNRSVDWFKAFKGWAVSENRNMTGSSFFKSLAEFLNIPRFQQFTGDIRFSSDRKSILASRVVVFMILDQDSSKNKDGMLKMRDAIEEQTSIKAYLAALEFLFIEQYVLVKTETIRNLVICGITVLLMTAPFLLHPAVLLLLSGGFAALIIELLGMMAAWNVSLNSISMIVLTMALGFSVDYSAHVAHAYIRSDCSDAKSSMIFALSTTGASVVMGGSSTFLGMVVTGFASSEIFRIFFKMFLGIVGLGLFHGLVILPTLITLFRISRSPAKKEEGTQSTVISNHVSPNISDDDKRNGTPVVLNVIHNTDAI
eukprot:gene17761-9433_t